MACLRSQKADLRECRLRLYTEKPAAGILWTRSHFGALWTHIGSKPSRWRGLTSTGGAAGTAATCHVRSFPSPRSRIPTEHSSMSGSSAHTLFDQFVLVSEKPGLVVIVPTFAVAV